MKRTYTPWQEWKHPSKQTEYTEPTTLLAEDGTLLSPGWARHNVFDYDRDRVKKLIHRKEWPIPCAARSGTSISSPTATTWSS